MNQEEYKQWRSDALVMLNLRYTANESRVIIEWMDRIRGSHELELIGDEMFSSLLALQDAQHRTTWSLYNSLTHRIWLYAPYILIEDSEYLKEYNKEGSLI